MLAIAERQRSMDGISQQEAEAKLIEEVAAILCVEPSAVKPDASLPALGLDSMGFVELLVAIEKTFNVRLIESGLTREDFETVHALARRISKSAHA
jgi:acyl carrier protein